MGLDVAVVLGVRYLLVVLFFPFSALDKVLNFRGAVVQAQEVFKPEWLARLVLLCGLFIEVVMSLCILTGFADRLAALVFAGYCAATAVLYKRWWEPGDFWAKGDSKARTLFWDFLKNLSLAGGFLLLALGLHQGDWRGLLADPFGSSHPYAAFGPGR